MMLPRDVGRRTGRFARPKKEPSLSRVSDESDMDKAEGEASKQNDLHETKRQICKAA
jgi:hypothetical protein